MFATLTADIGQAKRDLQDHGYCLLECPLPPDEFKALRERLLTVAEQERADGSAFLYDGGNQRVFSLLNKGEEFEELVQEPKVCAVMEELLGFNFLLSSTHANVAGPGGASMYVHADQTFAPTPWPPYPFVANSMWMLDDFTPENGATRLVRRGYLRQQQNFFSSLQPEVLKRATPLMRRLLGWENYLSLGMHDGLP